MYGKILRGSGGGGKVTSLTRMASEDPIKDAPLASVEFEIFGKVQGKIEKKKKFFFSIFNFIINYLFKYTGCYFTKYTRDLCKSLGIGGWVKNTKSGTILGKMQGPKPYVDQM